MKKSLFPVPSPGLLNKFGLHKRLSRCVYSVLLHSPVQHCSHKVSAFVFTVTFHKDTVHVQNPPPPFLNCLHLYREQLVITERRPAGRDEALNEDKEHP